MKLLRLLTVSLLFALLLPLAVWGEGWTPESLPMVHLADRTRYLCNPDGVIAPAYVDSVDAVLRRLEDSVGVQSVVVVVKHLEGDDPYSFGMELGRRYGVGQKGLNTGLIVILATEDRSYQILTGEGLEATLPDAICSRVERRVMMPYLKAEKWDEAVYETVKALAAYAEGDDTLAGAGAGGGETRSNKRTKNLLSNLVALVIVLVCVFPSLQRKRTRRRCPKCGGKGTLRRQSETRVTVGGRRKLRTVWVCKQCGHREVEDRNEPPDTGYGTRRRGFGPIFMGGGLMGGGYGGSSGGFSSGGGSFGGGSFGGGGAGGRF